MYDVWKNALAEIEQQLSPANFSTWFQDTNLISNEDGNIIIGVKNSFYVKQLQITISKLKISNSKFKPKSSPKSVLAKSLKIASPHLVIILNLSVNLPPFPHRTDLIKNTPLIILSWVLITT